jgi:hypothetical protein
LILYLLGVCAKTITLFSVVSNDTIPSCHGEECA